MEPVRTCLGCRSRDSRSSLLRVVARDGEVIVDVSAVLPGRGAWLHPSTDCLTGAVRRNAFGRALRVVGPLGVDSVSAYLGTFPDHPEEQADQHMDK